MLTTMNETATEIGQRNHRVAVFAKVADPHVLAMLLCRVLDVRPLDAVIVARHAPGVLPTPMTFEQSQQLVAALGELGLQAAAIEAAKLPDLANAATIHHARCRDDGLEIIDLFGRPAEVIPWVDVAVIGIGRVPGETSSHFVEQGRPAVLSAAPLPSVGRIDAPSHKVLELWLVRRHPTTAYRIHHLQFNYQDLTGGKSESAAVNFERFARDVVHHAPGAVQTPSTHAFFVHDLLKYDFRTTSDLQQHVALHWVMAQST